MPNVDLSLPGLQAYTGSTPCPADFDAFWDEKVAQVWQMPLCYTCTPAQVPGNDRVRCYDVWVDGVNNAKLHAKYVLPVQPQPVPVVLQFHGYPGASRGWLEQLSFAGMGMAVLAMECPGQGGDSVYAAAPAGTLAADHIAMGLQGEPDGLYYVETFQNTCLMVRLALALPQLDNARIYTNGGSQGGALSLVCAALNPGHIRKCAALYPFLTDYRRAWDMDRDAVVFTAMKYSTRWFDPAGEHLDELFTKLGYIDVLNFVGRIVCPVLFGTGLRDVVIPPSAQFAAYRRIQAPKEHCVYPDFGHEEIAAFDDRLFAFFGEEDV